MRIFFFSLLILALASCNKKEKQNVLNRQTLTTQNFVIDPAKDTVIVTKGGSKISIVKGTFDDKGPVTIEIKEALTMNDMVKAGLTTMANGIPLQSGGMIFINGQQNGEEPRILKPIEIAVPTNDFNSRMKLFSGEIKPDSSLNWKKPEMRLNREELTITDTGQVLFQAKCASCHVIAKPTTGPALAFVTERRCMDWLKEMTRNFEVMFVKDECLQEQKRKYGSVMPSFPNLADSDIEAIYSYITKESEKLNDGKANHSVYDPCNNLRIKDSVRSVTIGKITTNKIGKVPDQKTTGEEPRSTINLRGSSPADSSKQPAPVIKKLPDEYYTFTIRTFGWFNIDIYVGNDPDFAEGKLLVTIKGSTSEYFNIYLIVPSKKIFVTGHKNKEGKYYFFYQEDGYVQLPQNKTAYILAFEDLTEKPMLGKIRFTASTFHEFTLELKPGPDIEKEIRDMKLDNFEFEIQHRKPETKLLINERLYRFECPKRPATDSTTTRPRAEADLIMDFPATKSIDKEP